MIENDNSEIEFLYKLNLSKMKKEKYDESIKFINKWKHWWHREFMP